MKTPLPMPAFAGTGISSPAVAPQQNVVCDHAPNVPHPPDRSVAGLVGAHLCLNPRAAPPQAPAPSLDARGQWLTPECQHTIPKLLRLAAPHIPPLAAAFVRDMHAAADRLDAAPSAPSDALRKVLEMIRADMTPANIQYESHYLRQFIVAWATKIDAALTASPSESREQGINAAWISGCLAGRAEAARLVDSYRMIGQPSVVASRILALPAPTAPKEPQR